MSRVALVQRFAGGAAAFVAVVIIGMPVAASAADFDYYDRSPVQRPYAPPPPPVVQYERQTYVPPPAYDPIAPQRRVEIDPDDCRVTVKRYQDSYGRDVTRRTRDCGAQAYSNWPPRPDYGSPVRERYGAYETQPRPDTDADDID